MIHSFQVSDLFRSNKWTNLLYIWAWFSAGLGGNCVLVCGQLSLDDGPYRCDEYQRKLE